MMTPNFSIRLITALALVAGSFAPLRAEDQAGAEKTKVPVKVAVVDAVKWNSEPVGNIEVRYTDGTRDRWTTKGSCGQPRVAADGTVGWTVFEPEHPAQTASYNIRPNGTLVICRKGKVLCRAQAALGFIEEWDFLKDGKRFVVKSRALHGPAADALSRPISKERHGSPVAANPKRRFLFIAALFAVAAAPCFGADGNKLRDHDVVLDKDGRLLPWTTYDDVLKRSMNFIKHCPTVPTKFGEDPWYLVTSKFSIQGEFLRNQNCQGSHAYWRLKR